MQLEKNQLPELWCPFPPRISPYAEQVHRGTCEWLERFDLGNDTYVHEVSGLAARVHVETRLEILQFISDVYAWLFCQDDLYDKEEFRSSPTYIVLFHTRLLNILRGASAYNLDNPLGFALAELRHRSSELASPRWVEQFTERMASYFSMMSWEAVNREQNIMPSLDTYIRLRPITAGLGIEQVLTLLADEVKLPFSNNDEMIQQMTLLADQSVCWVNDILSFSKESECGDMHNIITVLKYELGLSEFEAINYVISLHNQAVKRFDELAKQLLSHGSDQDGTLQRYICALETRISGHINWASTTARYQLM